MKNFLVYIDLLGYEKRAEEEAKNTGRPVEDIRESYVGSIERRLKDLTKIGIINRYKKSEGADDFIVFTGNIWNVFKTIGDVLKAKLPLAIGIGFWKVDDFYLIERSDETISNLKTNIIPKYKTLYEGEHGKHSLTQTFILLTPDTYEQLDSKRKCFKPYPSEEFYFIQQKEVEMELKVLDFLEKIGSQRAEYREIEELYVAPKNYDRIKSTLDENNIVFIIGDAEMGKTYTAIRLLWEYFKEGYEPVCIYEERRREQWEVIRHKTDFDGKAIYLEDPWGKIEFERLESLFKEIGSFVSEVKRKRCKIIITSREKVFKEFENENETTEDLGHYAIHLKINLAYNKKKLAEMLRKYITIFEPAWSDNEELKEVALKAFEKKLRTPMSIKKLIDYSKNVVSINELEAVIEKAAEETKKSFANEIKKIFYRGDYDKIVFLSLTYIVVEPEVAKLCYDDVLKDLGCSMKSKDFNDLFQEFSEVEISQTGYIFQVKIPEYSLTYVHSSYREAFKYALTDKGKPNNISVKIFSKVLLKLCEINKSIESVGFVLISSFEEISEAVRNKLLPFFAEKDEFAVGLAHTIQYYFDKIPEEIRNKLLLTLSENYEAAEPIAWALEFNFDKIPEEVRNKLLLTLSRNDLVAENVVAIIFQNFYDISEDMRNLLFKLADNECAEDVAEALLCDFYNLPEDIRNKLLIKLSKTIAARYVAQFVAENFENLPEQIRNLLDDLQEELQYVIEEDIEDPSDKIELISKARTKIDKRFALKILNEILYSKDEKERTKAKVLIEQICEDSSFL